MDETVDGEYQNFKAKGGSYTRENFFAKDPEVLKMVEDMSDEQVEQLNRGHDPIKFLMHTDWLMKINKNQQLFWHLQSKDMT